MISLLKWVFLLFLCGLCVYFWFATHEIGALLMLAAIVSLIIGFKLYQWRMR